MIGWDSISVKARCPVAARYRNRIRRGYDGTTRSPLYAEETVRIPRIIRRACRSLLLGVIGLALLMWALATPGVRHMHEGGDEPHDHSHSATHSHSHSRSHSHKHGHSHAHGHGHHHTHGHAHHHHERAATISAETSTNVWHTHISILGFVITLWEPGSGHGLVTWENEAEGPSQLPVDTKQRRRAPTTAQRKTGHPVIGAAASTEWLNRDSGGPVPKRIQLSADRYTSCHSLPVDEFALLLRFPPPTPPPRLLSV